MKKTAFYLLPTLILAGCAQGFDLVENAAVEPQRSAATSEPLTRSVDGAIYNEIIDGWMIPQPDPFALANVQAAYDRLASGRSAQTLSKSQAAEFPAGERLSPTHYALKIYPQNEDEQWRVEMMQDVKVAYQPFSYSQLTQEEVAKVEQSGRTRSAANTFAEKSPYTVTYENYETTDGGPTGPVTVQLPILYTVWPVEKTLPENLEYEMDYPVFLPETPAEKRTRADNSVTTSDLLFGEAIAHSRVEGLTRGHGDGHYYGFYAYNICEGKVTTYDNTIGKDVPMPNLKVRYQHGSDIIEWETNSDGFFHIIHRIWIPAGSGGNTNPSTSQLTYIYQDPHGRWKIVTNANSSIPYSIVPTNILPSTGITTHYPLVSSEYQENEIHRAVNHYYNNQTYFTPLSISGGLKIVAHDVNSSVQTGSLGSFSYSSLGLCRVNMYNHGNSAGSIIGTTLHELGHAAHFGKFGLNAYKNISNLLQESFASYVGWYLGQEYYVSQGATRPGNGNWTIVGQNRQSWHKTDAAYFVFGGKRHYYGWYSPVFVDLTDTYNQKTSSSSHYPNDNIQGVPASVIWSVVSTCTTWPACRTALQNHVGTYYTATQFNDWIADFNTWASTYPLTPQ